MADSDPASRQDPMDCHFVTLLYRSIARFPDLDPSDLDILREALRFNQTVGVTGFLWRANGQFFQVLHGEANVIDQLMARIARDDRHRAVEVLLREPAPAASRFADWAMGYDYLMENQLCLGLTPDDGRPAICPQRAREIVEAMVVAACEARDFGSGFPFSRHPGETCSDYLLRLDRG